MLKGGKYFLQRLAIDTLQFVDRLLRRKGRHLILQLRQLIGDIRRQQVAACGQHLTELDEDRPQRFERETQSLTARGGKITPEEEQSSCTAKPGGTSELEHHLVEAVVQTNAGNFGEAKNTQRIGRSS